MASSNIPETILHLIRVASALKAFYLGTSTVILLAYALRPLRERFLAYGARNAADNNKGTDSVTIGSKSNGTLKILQSTPISSSITAFLDFVVTFQVPHSWFTSFYLVSITSSLIWLQQLITLGPLYQTITKDPPEQLTSMSLDQVALCWSLMAIQGTRRLLECFSFNTPSKSKMWVFHWVVGVLFYIATGIAIWIEGIPALESSDWKQAATTLSVPSLRTIICLAIFVWISLVQNSIHRHLACLEKYTLPFHPAFRKILCPHYTCECVIYATLTFLAAPEDHLTNNTLLCALVFVVVNLGVTADISKQWAVEKFGKKEVEDKWRMIAGIW